MSKKAQALEIAVIGAGVLGLSSALWLQQDGHRVSLFDAQSPGSSTSFGNAGVITTGSVEPTSTPGILMQIPKYLLDPESAIRIRWAYLPKLMPWLLRFLWASRPKGVKQASDGLACLMQQAHEAHVTLAKLTNATGHLHQTGWLKVYSNEKSFAGTKLSRRLMDRHDISYEILNYDELRQLEPALSRDFQFGLLHQQSSFANTPQQLSNAYMAHFIAQGGLYQPQNIQRLEPLGDGRIRLHTQSAAQDFDRIILCAGAWSKKLAADLGDKVILDTERGYHLLLEPGQAGQLRRPVYVAERHFVLCPMNEGIRITSGEELAGLDAPPDYNRIRKLIPHAQQALPGLSSEVKREWMGRRPSTPDSLPVIGPSPRHPHVLYNFGHQHLGLTLGPISGKIIADHIAGRFHMDLAPYRINRF